MRLLLAIDDSKFAEAATHEVLFQVRQHDTQALLLHALDWRDWPTVLPSGERKASEAEHGA